MTCTQCINSEQLDLRHGRRVFSSFSRFSCLCCSCLPSYHSSQCNPYGMYIYVQSLMTRGFIAFPSSLMFSSIGGIKILERAYTSHLSFQYTAFRFSGTLDTTSPLFSCRRLGLILGGIFFLLWWTVPHVDHWKVSVRWSNCPWIFCAQLLQLSTAAPVLSNVLVWQLC
jgi:hypothetical protein